MAEEVCQGGRALQPGPARPGMFPSGLLVAVTGGFPRCLPGGCGAWLESSGQGSELELELRLEHFRVQDHGWMGRWSRGRHRTPSSASL